ncbi:MAG: stage III sporulation AC/AD family protein [Lachnospiraceae bacterium]|nr:stage III sporulation AC/AD family protein [Lachnospiraceae bacterium]
MDILNIMAFAFCGLFMVILLKSAKPEYGLWVSVALTCVLAAYVLGNLSEMITQVEAIWLKAAGSSSLLGILLRIIGISCLCEITASLCKESGCLALAGQVTLAGKLAILSVGFPVLLELITFILELGQ